VVTGLPLLVTVAVKITELFGLEVKEGFRLLVRTVLVGVKLGGIAPTNCRVTACEPGWLRMTAAGFAVR